MLHDRASIAEHTPRTTPLICRHTMCADNCSTFTASLPGIACAFAPVARHSAEQACPEHLDIILRCDCTGSTRCNSYLNPTASAAHACLALWLRIVRTCMNATMLKYTTMMADAKLKWCHPKLCFLQGSTIINAERRLWRYADSSVHAHPRKQSTQH